MNSCWNVGLAIVGIGSIHYGQVENKVPDLAVELVLVDIPIRPLASYYISDIESHKPFSPTTSRDVDVSINESNSREVLCALDRWPGICITDELRIVIPVN